MVTSLKIFRLFTAAATALFLAAAIPGAALAKSLYVIGNINSDPTPIHSYELGAAPSVMTFQAEQTFPALAGGAVGIALDEGNKVLFITYEVSNTIQMLSAITFADLGTTTAPGAYDLAGVVFHESKNRVYAVDRYTNNLYVYDWDAGTSTLTLIDGGGDSGNGEYDLLNVSESYGLALDETRDRLFVADGSTNVVRYFETDTFTESGNITLETHAPISIAVNQTDNVLYTGAAFNGSLRLVAYDLTDDVETNVDVATSIDGFDGVVGVAVDEDTGNVYVTTGFDNDMLVAFDDQLVLLQAFTKEEIQAFGGGTGWGDPTGLVIPRTEITYGESEAVSFSGKGESVTGVGSAGPLFCLLLGVLAVSALTQGRLHRRNGILLGALAVAMLGLGSTEVYAQDDEGWYLGVGAGSAQTGVKSADLDSRLEGIGYTTSSRLKDTDSGWKTFVGYDFNDRFALEATFVDLGEITSDIDVEDWPDPGALDPAVFVADAVTVHPYSVGGFAVTGVATLIDGENVTLQAKAGVFSWEADVKVWCATECSDIAKTTEDGTDWTAGLALGFDLGERVGMRAEWERYATDRDDVDLYTASMLYRF